MLITSCAACWLLPAQRQRPAGLALRCLHLLMAHLRSRTFLPPMALTWCGPVWRQALRVASGAGAAAQAAAAVLSIAGAHFGLVWAGKCDIRFACARQLRCLTACYQPELARPPAACTCLWHGPGLVAQQAASTSDGADLVWSGVTSGAVSGSPAAAHCWSPAAQSPASGLHISAC